MKERPIILKPWEVRAFLDGRKTQLRRIVKPQPLNHSWSVLPGYKLRAHVDVADGKTGVRFYHSVERQDAKDSLHQDENWIVCPLGKPGDRLWVKETWMPFEVRGSAGFGPKVEIGYKATNDIRPDGVSPLDFGASLLFDCTDVEWEKFRDIIEKMDVEGDKWFSAVPMPRRASRITLEITNVRGERLQDISEEDARAEGADYEVVASHAPGCDGFCNKCPAATQSWVASFKQTWQSTYGPDSWDADPWVWVVEVKPVC